MRIPKIVKFTKKDVYKKVRNKRFDILTFTLIFIAVFLSIAATCYTAFKMYEIRNGKDVGDIYKHIKRNDDIFNISSYISDLEVTIASNKNTNTYNIKQWYLYKENILKTKTEFKDASR